MELENYNPVWSEQFGKEAALIRTILEPEEIIDIQHIGSTAINGIKAKPIIDIAVLVSPDEYIQSYVRPLSKIGYVFYPQSSSVERLFFRKGVPVQFHLSITQSNITSYWNRQITFRDYLCAHPEAVQEYQSLKEELLKIDPSAGQKYTDGKSSFIAKILRIVKSLP